MKTELKIGLTLGLICFVLSLIYFIKILIIDSWKDIVHNSSGVFSNVLGWLLIYSFLALILSVIISIIIFGLVFLTTHIVIRIIGKSKK